jgi:phenylacetate-coenzyme A ligase PaaK-like adenylate-forming protein
MFSYKWPKEKQKEWGFKRLLKYLKEYVEPYHPYYRKTFKELGIDVKKIKTYEDFCKIPITTKQLMLEDYLSFILQPKFPGREALYDTAPVSKKILLKHIIQGMFTKTYAALKDEDKTLKEKIANAVKKEWMPVHFHASGGTTGNPSPALYTWYDIHKNLPPSMIMSSMCGLKKEYRALNLFPAAPHLAFFAVVLAEVLLGGSAFHTCGGQVVPTERQIELCQNAKFDYLLAIPSYLTYWLEVAEKMQKEGKIGKIDSLKYAIVAGEPMVPAYRERLKSQFEKIGSNNVKIIEAYGMTEVKIAFFECDEETGIHLGLENFFWEVLDPETKEPVGEGKPGVLTFSHIGWRGTVFIRYFTGDLVNGMVWERCDKCGFIIPRLLTPMCRAVKDFTKIKGARVPLVTLQTAIRNSTGVDSFQVIITKQNLDDPFSRDYLKVYVTKKQEYDEQTVTESIKKNVKLDCEITPNEIIFETPERLEKRLFERTHLKADWVIDERKIHV